MPAWITHFVTANRVADKLKIEDKNSFLFGNIVPDILNNHFVKNTNVHGRYEQTHFAKKIVVNGKNCDFPDLDRFSYEYKDKMNNPIVCGCYIHLITDYYWNMNFRQKYSCDANGLTSVKLANGETKIDSDDKIIKIKHEDFRIFTEYLKLNNVLHKIVYTNRLFEYCKDIEEIPLTKQDILDTLKVIDDFIDSKIDMESGEYSIYTQDKLNEDFEGSIGFILDRFKLKG